MNYREIIKNELSTRCNHNPMYSMRSFARLLGIDVGNLSRCLNNKANISIKTAMKIADCLAFDVETKENFLNSLALERGSKFSENHPRLYIKTEEIDPAYFEKIGEIHHSAILELTYVKNFKSDEKWIASQLGLSEQIVKQSIERLLKSGLLINDSGILKKACKNIIRTTKGLTTSASLRKHQRQVLEKSFEALETVPISQRCHISMTMPIDEDKLEFARKKIEDFTEELCKQMAVGTKTKVYQLGVGFFPLQKGDV